MIPPYYTGLLQPCDIEINKSLKDCLKTAAADWLRDQHTSLKSGEKLPLPEKKAILIWLKKIWKEFPITIVHNSFTGNGYYFEDGVDYSVGTESDSDLD